MAFMKEKKEHDYLMKLLQKHFNADEIEEAMSDIEEDEDRDDKYFDELEDELEEEKEDMLPRDEMMEDDDEEEDEEEEEVEENLPKDKRKGLAVVIIQKRMSKPKKDLY